MVLFSNSRCWDEFCTSFPHYFVRGHGFAVELGILEARLSLLVALYFDEDFCPTCSRWPNFRFARHPRVAATANQPRNKLLESLFLFTIDSPGRCRRFHWRRLPRVTAPDSHLYYGLPCVFASLEKFVITVTDWATCCTIRLRRNFFPSGATS